jgi:hypothetical protein
MGRDNATAGKLGGKKGIVGSAEGGEREGGGAEGEGKRDTFVH